MAACQALPDFPNRPLAAGTTNPEPARLGDHADPNRPILLMAFSGGGARAAALGLGVLDELRDSTYPWAGRPESLVDRVEVISSVSGGSVIGAWFALVGPTRMDDMRDKFLRTPNMASLERQAADPITLSRLVFSRYTRIDVERDLFAKELFGTSTFADLNRPGAPFLILNATDIASGEVFAFTPERFDDICSDLRTLPLSVGVAASAAFPVALSPMSLRNYSYESCQTQPAPAWITNGLTLQGQRYVNLEAYKHARYANALRDGPTPPPYRDEHYVHLVDGGVADNQGIHSLIDAITASHSQLGLLNAISVGDTRRVVVISVNARSDAENKTGANPAVPGVFDVLNAVFSVPIDATTAYANASLQELIATLQNAGAQPVDARGQQRFSGLHVYSIPIDFDQFLPSPEQQALQLRVKNVGTSWDLTDAQLADTLLAGRILLRQHPCLQRLLLDLNSSAPPGEPALDASNAYRICAFADDQRG